MQARRFSKKMEAVACNDKKPLIRECFESDENYLKFHFKSDQGLESCIEITFSEINNLDNYNLYKVIDGADTVGMFGIENENVLNPFFIKPNFRNSKYVGKFLDLVYKKLKKEAYIGLYERNVPIIKFFQKNGATYVSEGLYNDQKVIVYKLSLGEL